MTAETRDFIPTGRCVEQDRELFADPASTDLAAQSCLACPQLDNCRQQQIFIGAILIVRGDKEPVVGGEVATPPPDIDLRQVMRFGEVTLRFDRRVLPENGQRALRSMQQALRAGQTTQRPLTHPSFDIATWVEDQLEERDPDILKSFDGATRASIAYEIGHHILAHGARRSPGGRIYRTGAKFRGLDPEKYYPFVRAFAAETAAHAELGLPDPAKRTSRHGLEFHLNYLKAGARANIPHSYLLKGLRKGPTDPWKYALNLVELKKAEGARRKERRRERSPALSARQKNTSQKKKLSASAPRRKVTEKRNISRSQDTQASGEAQEILRMSKYLNNKNEAPFPQPFRPFNDADRLVWFAGGDTVRLDACGAEFAVRNTNVITAVHGQPVELSKKDKLALLLFSMGASFKDIDSYCFDLGQFRNLLLRTGVMDSDRSTTVYACSRQKLSRSVVLTCRELLVPKASGQSYFEPDFTWIRRYLSEPLSSQVAYRLLKKVGTSKFTYTDEEDIPDGAAANLQILLAYGKGKMRPDDYLAPHPKMDRE